MTTAQTIIGILVLFNIVTFCLYWWDKEAARDGEWRVRESRLLAFALFGGSIGAVAAQQLLRHKTRKEPFRTQLCGIVTLHIVLMLAFVTSPLWMERAIAAI